GLACNGHPAGWHDTSGRRGKLAPVCSGGAGRVLQMGGRRGMIPMRVDLPYLSVEPDRHGNDRLYLRRYGRRQRITEEPGTPAVWAAYRAGLDELETRRPLPAPAQRSAARPGSLRWLAGLYFASEEFLALDPVSQRTRRNVIESCLEEPRKPGSLDLMADCPV